MKGPKKKVSGGPQKSPSVTDNYLEDLMKEADVYDREPGDRYDEFEAMEEDHMRKSLFPRKEKFNDWS